MFPTIKRDAILGGDRNDVVEINDHRVNTLCDRVSRRYAWNARELTTSVIMNQNIWRCAADLIRTGNCVNSDKSVNTVCANNVGRLRKTDDCVNDHANKNSQVTTTWPSVDPKDQ